MLRPLIDRSETDDPGTAFHRALGQRLSPGDRRIGRHRAQCGAGFFRTSQQQRSAWIELVRRDRAIKSRLDADPMKANDVDQALMLIAANDGFVEVFVDKTPEDAWGAGTEGGMRASGWFPDYPRNGGSSRSKTADLIIYGRCSAEVALGFHIGLTMAQRASALIG